MKRLRLHGCRVDLRRVTVPIRKYYIGLRKCPVVAKLTLPPRCSLWHGLEVIANPTIPELILELTYEGIAIRMSYCLTERLSCWNLSL